MNYETIFNEKLKTIKLKDVFYSKEANIYLKPTVFQYGAYNILLSNIFVNFPSSIKDKIIILSGLRNKTINDILKQKNYPVSDKSDHLVPEEGINIKDYINKYNSNINIYIKETEKFYPNPIGSGAIDFKINGYDLKKHFELFIYLAKNFYSLTNQIILYKNNFIHISNSRHLIYPFNFNSSKKLLIFNGQNYIDYSIDLLENMYKKNKLPF